MTAYVHLGTGKTGTTSLQWFMAKNYEVLKNKGFVYSRVSLSLARHGYLNRIVRLYLEGKTEDKFVKDTIKNLKEELKQNTNKDFIFSSEDILWWHKDVDKAALALKDFFTEVGFDDIRIILYIRSQEDLLLSLCSQETKNADPTYNAKESKPENSPRFQMYEYKALAKAFMNTFGKENLILRLFDKNEFYQGDLIKDFLHIFNLDLDESFVLIPNKNESLDLIGFELLESINTHFKCFTWEHNGRNSFIPNYLAMETFLSKDPSLKFMPKKEIYESYITYFEESNEWVRKEFFPHKDRLFPKKDLSKYKENYELKEMKPEYWDMIASFIVDFAKDRKNIIDNKDKKIQELNTQVSNLNLNVSNLQNENSSLKQILSSQEHKAKTLKLSFLEEKVKRKVLKNTLLEKNLGFTHEDILQSKILNQKVKDLENLLSNIQSPQANIYTSAKLRVQNHLAYKLGQALILNSKSLKGYIRMPYVLSYIKEKHKLEQKAYNEKILKNPSLKLPSLDTYPDYAAALKEKECLTYKLGEALIEANKRGGGVAYLAFFKKARKLKKDFLANKAK
ncbi:hypothetical protein CAV_1486 [Campylobacter avium LMG 24591]|uniref:Uncharacterized protein n=1 Tax=Campylobacter avium LMG 24591 TaxID=522484 RepID=A0A222MZS7_9BACT|nr:hypothetical protein [Campylobacter avium]ASQ31096.1 hypothetical protein CAV_1486 [Campylobacter avium LMG 24591]OYD78479.1 hypothetical protein CAV8706_1482 [Campylobacter avium]